MRSLYALLLFVSLAFAPLGAGQTTPRKSPELVINYPNGKHDLLSNYRGKVVLLEIMFTTCPHCAHESQLVSKLNKEYAGRGFQPIGLAINPMANMLVGDFVKENGVNFPVGFSEREPALTYLGVNPYERWAVPQVVIIDRNGMIRAQTPPLSDEKFQNEAWLRQQIEPLLREGETTKRRGAPTRTGSASGERASTARRGAS
jgi:peroxiredoxin